MACPLTTVGTRRDTEMVACTEGGVMSDPVATLRERADVLTAALERWAGQAAAPDQAAALDQAENRRLVLCQRAPARRSRQPAPPPEPPPLATAAGWPLWPANE